MIKSSRFKSAQKTSAISKRIKSKIKVNIRKE